MACNGTAKKLPALGIVRPAAVPQRNIEHLIRAEGDSAAIMIELRLLDFKYRAYALRLGHQQQIVAGIRLPFQNDAFMIGLGFGRQR